VAVCNLASIALNRYVTPDKKFDFKQLEYVTGVIVRNLNKIIDINYYPVAEVHSLFICHCYTFHFLSIDSSILNDHNAGTTVLQYSVEQFYNPE
jgi:Ribonucleotide reductase, barrel domain